MASTKIAELAAQIQENTAKVDEYLQKRSLPSPSFDEDGPVDFQIEDEGIRKAREIALDSSLELHQLLLGPAMCLRPIVSTGTLQAIGLSLIVPELQLNGVSLQAIYKYDIASHVPIHGVISFHNLAAKCGLSETNVRRIVRFAIVYHRVFQEPRKGHVSHSAASRKLAEDANAKAGVGYMFDECWQSFAHTVEAMEKFKSDEPNKSGWSLAQKTDKPIWEYYASHPDMAKRFARSMSTFSNGLGLSPNFLVQSYSWSSISGHATDGDVSNGHVINGDSNNVHATNGDSTNHHTPTPPPKTGTVVDVGGSRGNISVALAQTHPHLSFIVHDLPDMIRGAPDDAVPTDLRDRIAFMPHDFFLPQPVAGADVYLFRNIFHNWSDAHVVRILRATIPALKVGARVVVNDYLIPEQGSMAPVKEREIRYGFFLFCFSFLIPSENTI